VIGLFIFIGAMLVLTGGGLLLIHALDSIVNGDPFLPGVQRVAKKIITRKAKTGELPDYKVIAALEMAEYGKVFTTGESAPIEGLPGCRWRIREDHAGDIEIKLIDASGLTMELSYVLARRVAPDKLESMVKTKMAEMVSAEKQNLILKTAKQSVIDKYNDTHVELEP
jgi:hypothetical protein